VPVAVHTPIKLRVDRRALQEQPELIEECLRAAVRRALRTSVKEVLSDRGAYLGVEVHSPRFRWSGTGLDGVPDTFRERWEAEVSSWIASEVELAGVLDRARANDEFDAPLQEPAQEPLDSRRFYPGVNMYSLDAYDRGGASTHAPVESGEPAHSGATETITTREWSTAELASADAAHGLLANLEGQWGVAPRGAPIGVAAPEGESGIRFYVFRQDGSWCTFTVAPFEAKVFNKSTGVWEPQRGVPRTPQIITLEYVPGPHTREAIIEAQRTRHGPAMRAVLMELPYPETMTPEERYEQIDEIIEAEIATRTSRVATHEAYVSLEMGSVSTILLLSSQDASVVHWSGTAYIYPQSIPITITQPVASPAERRDDDTPRILGGLGGTEGRGLGTTPGADTGTGGAGSGDAGDAGSGAGGSGTGGSGTGGAGSGGAGQDGGRGRGARARPRGGIVDTGVEGPPSEHAALYPTGSGGRAVELQCESLLGEPHLDDLGEDAGGLRSLMSEIAARLQMPTCDYVAQFCLNASMVLEGRAGSVASYSTTAEEGFIMPVTHRRGNLGAVNFRPTASPAIQYMRFLAATAPKINTLMLAVMDVYTRPAHRGKLNWYNPTSWQLHFLMEVNPQLKRAVGVLFAMTCRVVMMQLLVTSKRGIDGRLNNFAQYAPLFQRLIAPYLQGIDTFTRLLNALRMSDAAQTLHDTLSSPGGTVATAVNPWLQSASALTELFRVVESSHEQGAEGEIVREGGVTRIRDSRGTLWSQAQLETAIVTLRGTAEGIDPLVKQMTDIPEVMERFRATPNSTALRDELYRVLTEMRTNNEEMRGKVASDWMFAFRASSISESLPNATIPGTSLALGGVHLLAHQEIGYAFHGHGIYAAGVQHFFNVELGRQALTGFFLLTGIIMLSIACPVAGFLVGVAVAGYEVAVAHERERLLESLIDPEQVLSRAEVELGLFLAYFGLALSIIPEAGSIVKGAVGGARAVSRAGVVGGARIVGRRLARRVVREAIEAAERGFIQAFIREMVLNYAIEHLIQLALAPVIARLNREISIRSSVGGASGQAQVLRMIQGPSALPPAGGTTR
jgi:hypothetical protein